MAKPFIHSLSSAKKFGGVWTDYIELHELMDSSKAVMADNRHRALTHNSWFISVIIPKVFGEVMKRKSDGGLVSSRDIAEQHILEDYKMRFIPSPSDFLNLMPLESWMQNASGNSHPESYKKIKEHKLQNKD